MRSEWNLIEPPTSAWPDQRRRYRHGCGSVLRGCRKDAVQRGLVGVILFDPCQYACSELNRARRAREVMLAPSVEVAKAFLNGSVSQGAGAGQKVSLSSDVGPVLVYLSACFA